MRVFAEVKLGDGIRPMSPSSTDAKWLRNSAGSVPGITASERRTLPGYDDIDDSASVRTLNCISWPTSAPTTVWWPPPPPA